MSPDAKAIELLKESLQSERRPLLFLGAGFSYDGKNAKGDKIPLADELSQILKANLFDSSSSAVILSEDEQSELDYNVSKGHLKNICDLIKDCGCKQLRNKLLNQLFSGCTWNKDKPYSYLLSYQWQYIYSLNIDDLVENIYKTFASHCTVWTRSSEQYIDTPNSPVLIKLHGSVNGNSDDFVFDSEEYNSFTAEDNWMLRKFATDYMSHDVIFIGTSLQESDIKIALRKDLLNGCSNENYNCFFIDPKAPLRSLQNDIDTHPNFHYISWTTEQFLNFLHNEIEIPKNDYFELSSTGFVIWNQEWNNLCNRHPVHRDSQLYYGASPTIQDYYFNYDIIRNTEQQLCDSFLEENSSGIILLHGKSCVGKTCFCKRLLTNFSAKGYIALYCLHTSISELVSLKQYLSKADPRLNVVVCLENAAEFYYSVVQLYNQFKDRFNHLYFITVSDTLTHLSKEYHFKSVSHIVVEITEKTPYHFAESIYDKLDENTSLGQLLHYGEFKKDLVKFITSKNDLIDVLYTAHHGRSFADYFHLWAQQKDSNRYYPLFQGIVFLATLGISQLEISFLPTIATFLRISHFQYPEFKKIFNDFLEESQGYIHLRCMRLFADTALLTFTDEQRQLLIEKFSQLLALGIKEREQSKNNDIFELIIKVKNLTKEANFSPITVYTILSNIRVRCKHLSYYWIQCAIACRYLNKFEDAANALNYAEKARNDLSYQIAHARAKNEMEWGIWCLTKNSSQADMHFEDGCEQMLGLLLNQSPYYRNAFDFSVHSYIDMNLKYYRAAQRCPDIDTWNSLTLRAEQYAQSPSPQITILSNLLHDMESFALYFKLPFDKSKFHKFLQIKSGSSHSANWDIDELPWEYT